MISGKQNVNKEALFNEVKGSLFEFLVSKSWARSAGDELSFLKSIDANYLSVLSQQDRMVRQFYPELGEFLQMLSEKTAEVFTEYLGEVPRSPRLLGKFSNSELSDDLHETDILLNSSKGEHNISLKLNKKSSFVNTKSAGIKSFFDVYFPFLPSSIQKEFNNYVDQLFVEVSFALHEHNGWDYPGDYSLWVRNGKSELPGELDEEERVILRNYYAKISLRIHEILTNALKVDKENFIKSIPPLMGYSSPNIIQLVCFHDFKNGSFSEVLIHEYEGVFASLRDIEIGSYSQTSSVDIHFGSWDLQIRVKPMNKFTTTAMKMNCAIRFKQPSRELSS